MSSTCFEPGGSFSGRQLYIQLWNGTLYMSGLGSSVGIATDYGLDDPGSNPSGDEIFPPVQTGAGAHPVPVKWVPGLSQG